MDTKIQAQLRDKIKRVERGRRKEQWRLVERDKGWPVWPALSLEHVAADEAKIKGGKKGTLHKHPSPRHWPLRDLVHLYLCVSF